MSGTLENIAAQLTALNANLAKVLAGDTAIAPPAAKPAAKPARAAKPAKVEEPEETEELDESDEEPEVAPAPKKAAAKKAPAKAAPKKAPAKAKADDLSNMVTFKKALFEAAEASKVDEFMPKLKQYLKAQGYVTSDEIEVADRADFVANVKEHFADLAEGTSDEEDEIDI